MNHYFSEKQTAQLRLRKIKAVLRNSVFHFYTASGVFSAKRVDLGTELLINKSIIKPAWRVLDFGCGYGAVGISVAKLFPSTKVFMTDTNSRAVKLAKMNAKLSGVNAIIKQGDMLSAFEKEKFNSILLNPPQAAGNDVCFRMIAVSKQHLLNKGLLQLVGRHNKGGRAFSTEMEKVFGNVNVIAKRSGYRIYVSRK